MDNNISYLGENSYPAFISNVKQSILNLQCSTSIGDELCKDFHKQLNESITPYFDLKQFITKAEKYAPEDTKLEEFIKMCSDKANKGNLNFIANICKEEHFKNLLRTGHPNPEDTIKNFKDIFNEANSVIENAIRTGVLNGLQSNLLDTVKNKLTMSDAVKTNQDKLPKSKTEAIKNISESLLCFDVENDLSLAKKLSEYNSTMLASNNVEYTINSFLTELTELSGSKPKLCELITFIKGQIDVVDVLRSKLEISKQINLNENQVFNGNLVKYSPVGFKIENIENNTTVLLFENQAVTYDSETNTINPLNESLNLSPKYKRLNSAINELVFNPEDGSFTLNESWDFNLKLKTDGKLSLINKNNVEKPFKKEHLKQFLFESLNVYENINKPAFIRDADNLIMLTENHNKLISFDNITVIRDLNESNNFIIYDKETINNGIPKFISSSTGNNEFASFKDLLNESSKIVGQNLINLFESQVNDEIEERNNNAKEIVSLNESNSKINEMIEKTEKLINISEDNSPAKLKLIGQLDVLNKKLEKNLRKLKNLI